MVERILSIIKNPKLLKKIGQQARETMVNSFSIEETALKYKKLYNNLIDRQ